jgi:hypothetical protein
MANKRPQMPTGHHREHMNLPNDPNQLGGGVQGFPQLLRPTDADSRIPRPPTNTHFFQEHKSTLAPLHPITPKESPNPLPGTGERETPSPLSD